MTDDWKDDVMAETYGPASDANLPRSMTHEAIKALVGQISYDVEDGTGAMVMVSRQVILAAIEALKPMAEGTHVVVPANVIAYLRGEGSLEGKWFGDPFGPFGPSRPYWWRHYLPEVPAAPSAEKDETT